MEIRRIRPVTSTTFVRDLVPETIVTASFGTPTVIAMSRTSASFAAPSTAEP